MKKVFIYIFLAITSVCVQAQNTFFYQSALKNIDGNVIANKNIHVRFLIETNGTTVYSETHQTRTDVNGYFTLYIGEGTPEAIEFAKVDWTKGNYQIKTEIDKGEGYTLAGNQELASVPYAMQAEVAGGIQQKLANGATWNITVDDNGKLVAVPYPFSKLVFQDDFNGTGLPDPSKWNFEEGYVRGNEMQYYTVGREENCYQKDGLLHIVCENEPALIKNAKVNNQSKNEWTERRKDTIISVKSASITTKGLKYWKYCRVDVKAKLPMCKGTWPAIWMMPQWDKYGYWPKSGEIDIMEHVGYDPNLVHYTLHCTDHNSGTWPNPYNKSVTCPTSYTEFHVYSLEWTKDRIAWYLDGKLKFTVNKPQAATIGNWPFDEEFYLILNQAFGGSWGGREGVDLDGLPQDYQIDYVRVYQ